MVQLLDMDLTLGPELEAEHPAALKKVAGPLQNNPEVTLADPDQVQHQHLNLTPVRVQLLDVEYYMTPLPTTGMKLPSAIQDIPSQPPEPSMKTVNQHTVPTEMTTPIPLGQDIAQSPSFPSVVVQTLYMALSMIAKAIQRLDILWPCRGLQLLF